MATDVVGQASAFYGSISSMAGSAGVPSLAGKTFLQRVRDGEVLNFMTRMVKLCTGGKGSAEIVVTPTHIIMATNSTTGIGIGDGSIVLDGRVSFTRSPDNICINGFWRLNEELLTTLPSTLMNPIETLVFKYPSYIRKASKVLSLLGG